MSCNYNMSEIIKKKKRNEWQLFFGKLNGNLPQTSDLYIQNNISYYEEQYAKHSFYEA